MSALYTKAAALHLPAKRTRSGNTILVRDDLEFFRSRQRHTLNLCSTAALRFAIAFCSSCDKLSCLKEDVLAACLMCRVEVRPGMLLGGRVRAFQLRIFSKHDWQRKYDAGQPKTSRSGKNRQHRSFTPCCRTQLQSLRSSLTLPVAISNAHQSKLQSSKLDADLICESWLFLCP